LVLISRHVTISSNSKVSELYYPLASDQDVRGLYVAMDNMFVVQVNESLKHLLCIYSGKSFRYYSTLLYRLKQGAILDKSLDDY